MSSNQKSKKKSNKKNSQEPQDKGFSSVQSIDESEEFQEGVSKVNQQQNNKLKINLTEKKKNDSLSKDVLKKLPDNKKNKRKSSVNSSENEGGCSSPVSQKSTLSDRFSHFIGHFRRAPEFSVDNKFIFTGYRVNYSSVKNIFKSLFHIHNESVNIWTHALGAIFVIGLILYVALSQNVLGLQGIKNQITEDFRQKINPLYEEFQAFENNLVVNLDSYSAKLKESYNSVDIQGKLGSIQGKLSGYLKEIQNANLQDIDQYVDKMVHEIPHTVDQYKKAIENLKFELNINSETFNKQFGFIHDWEVQLLNYQSEYMQNLAHINNTDIKNVHSKMELLDDSRIYVKQSVQTWPIILFLVTACLCLLFSATFHLFFVYKEKYYKYFLRLDYAGVSLLISGSTVPCLYYGFYCNPALANFYITLVSIACIIVFIVSLQDFIHTPKYWAIKSIMYASLGIFAALPIVHLTIHEMYYAAGDEFTMGPSVVYYGLMGFCYLGGLFVYAHRCPERYHPGQFDICGASHQIWHVSIIAAIIVTYIAVNINFYTRCNSVCPNQIGFN